jgi:hypothetical protein
MEQSGWRGFPWTLKSATLEALDFLVDPSQERLVPRDPKRIIAEEE